LLPRYAQAQTISFTDERIKPQYVQYPSAGGTSGQMKGYLVQPSKPGPHPAVLVIHENRGLNPYVEDVARRLGAAGFLALAPDGLAPVGGYPGNDEEGTKLQASLDPQKLLRDMFNSAVFLKNHARSNGRLGAVGFCWGGGVVNYLAAEMGADLRAGAPYYGAGVDAAKVPQIKAELVIHFAANDPRINTMWPAYETALKSQGIRHTSHSYAATQHGFHNNSTPRYNAEAAELSWTRTLELFKQTLS
jgi:carboxymethylenebutenolidase